MIKWALLFKDSMSGTEERIKLLDSHTNCKMHAQIQKPSAARFARGIARTFTLNKFRSRISEAASPKRCCSHVALLTAIPRRSEARPRLTMWNCRQHLSMVPGAVTQVSANFGAVVYGSCAPPRQILPGPVKRANIIMGWNLSKGI